MEVIIFDDKKWNEIPEQDNPAFDYLYDDNRLKEGFRGRRNACIMICKVMEYRSNAVGENGYSVIEVPLNGDVITRGLFWNIEYAKIFAYAIANRNK